MSIVLVGPFWTREQASAHTDTPGKLLLARRDVLHIGARLSQEVYPIFQFGRRCLRPDIGGVVELFLDADVTGAVIADWIVRPHPELGASSPLNWLDSGRPAEAVLTAAGGDTAVLQELTQQLREHNLPFRIPRMMMATA